MKKATGRRAQYLSHQNKMAEAQLGERSAKLDRQFVSTRSAYELERRHLAQELRDLYRDKKRTSARSTSTPPTTSRTSPSGCTDVAVRKMSVPSKILPATRDPDHICNSSEGQTFFRRPRVKARSLVDLPGELRRLERANILDYNISCGRLPSWKHDSASVMNKENTTKKTPRSTHYLTNISSAESLPPISALEGMSYFPSLQKIMGRRGDEQPIVEHENTQVSQTIKRGTGLNQQPQLQTLTLRDQSGNESKELGRLVETSMNSPLSEQTSTVTSFTRQSIILSEQYGNKGKLTYRVLTDKTDEETNLKQNFEDISWLSLRSQENASNDESKAEIEEYPVTLEMKSGFGSPRIPDPDNRRNKNSRLDPAVKHESETNLATKRDNLDSPASPNTQTSFRDQSGVSKSRKSSLSIRKTSTSSQQGCVLLGQAPSQEALQKAARKVSIDSCAPSYNVSAAVHGKTRRAGTGLAPYMSNVFLDQAEARGDVMMTGGVALDSELVVVSTFNPSRRPSYGVPTNAAERSRERGSLALRGNRVRQEDPSTAELIRYYQDVPEAAALAGISVEPLDLSELDSCRYLRKYVPKSMRDGDGDPCEGDT